ncbi:fumarylacetoacetate hydrolase family protein [Porticoccaceae bacterium]|nr:fumarylacetoacetate hydrolase family protein [Porticoccaceae bacterium]
MKLASLKQGRDGQLVLVNSTMELYVSAASIAPTLQAALDNWANVKDQLQALSDQLDNGNLKGQPFDAAACASPLPRAYHWADGSAYVNHVELVRKARNATMPESFWTDPLIYQGGSDTFLGPREDISMATEDWGIDFEAEVAVIVDDVPMGVSAEDAQHHIKLLMLVNDVSLRNLIPGELAKGFGFYQAKPSSAFSPTAVTPDTLGDAWDGAKLHLPLRAVLNGDLVGQPNAGVDMTFDFGQLIAHAAKTRPLCAGTIIGSGTVSNLDRSNGSCCLAEVRMLETIAEGKPSTEFMRFGDRIQIAMLDAQGQDIFGEIDQQVAKLGL